MAIKHTELWHLIALCPNIDDTLMLTLTLMIASFTLPQCKKFDDVQAQVTCWTGQQMLLATAAWRQRETATPCLTGRSWSNVGLIFH